ncbi:MAG: hypothetical protein LBP71_04405, partial [Spirochaetaceae bacterium]|nr:hypothetical protein [Spirochaetaceae bacterium]
LKQTFAQRYNRLDGRIGHIWGDRYWSRILDGEPELVEEVSAGDLGIWNHGVSPQGGKSAANPAFPPNSPRHLAPAPG